MDGKGHILVLPFPAQGHVIPFMELSHRLVDHGFEVTFVNTEAYHSLVLAALPQASGGETALGVGIHLASIPDGLTGDDDRKDIGKVTDACSRHVPQHLERLIAEMEATGRPKVKWLVGDMVLGSCFEVAKKLDIRVATFWTASAACLAIMLSAPKLVDEGVINDMGKCRSDMQSDDTFHDLFVEYPYITFLTTRTEAAGWAERDETFELAPGMPTLPTSQMPWMDGTGTPVGHPALFELITRFEKFNSLAEVVVCNSLDEAEVGTFKLFPDILPIGPLFADGEFRKPVGNFLPEDERCIKWLDAQPNRSVVYVAFGSMAIFDPRQFEELAQGLELTGRPFLWVVRPDFTVGLNKAWLAEFQQRVAGTSIIVSWCSQQQVDPYGAANVLAHRAVACFVSHCGWNSTMEGVRNGVPFVCWPYFCDQYLDRSYITNVWRVGLAVSPSADGIVTKEELRSKVEQVLGDDDIKERARLFMDASRRSIRGSGSSFENFIKFVDLLSE
ncbi:hypothetical protein HU200_004369 [Digitaria exilis]|uniref:Glycosyltransferase n=1 Tax=Digitaria exilis TaxID=1010633 RepID=A0A835KTT2_9POAL|nr:hypothetical protein HU200_004369 [Digitaria exilis]